MKAIDLSTEQRDEFFYRFYYLAEADSMNTMCPWCFPWQYAPEMELDGETIQDMANLHYEKVKEGKSKIRHMWGKAKAYLLRSVPDGNIEEMNDEFITLDREVAQRWEASSTIKTERCYIEYNVSGEEVLYPADSFKDQHGNRWITDKGEKA